MGIRRDERKNTRRPLVTTELLLVATAFILPSLSPPLFGWINGLLAIPVFWVLRRMPGREGMVLLGKALFLSGIVATFLQGFYGFLFSLTLVPLGYCFQQCSLRGMGPVTAGGMGIAVLTLCWVVFWGIYGWLVSANPYVQLQNLFDQSFVQMAELYRQNNLHDVENLYRLEQAISSIRTMIPKILPGILGCTVISTVWVNLIGGNSLLRRQNPALAPWPKYGSWRLPDNLVWGAIVSMALLLIGHGNLYTAGLTGTLIFGLIYFFQGLAVLVYYLDRWHTPKFIRFLVYLLVVVQSYGILLLTVTGLADVWIDFRNRGNLTPSAET